MSRLRHIESRAQAKGTILEVKSYSAAPGRSASIEARVRYQTAGGESVEFKDSLPNHVYGEGDEVTVLYDPRAPREAELYLWEEWVLPALLFFLGAAPALMYLGWAYRDHQERKKKRRKGIRDEDQTMTWPATSRRPKLPK